MFRQLKNWSAPANSNCMDAIGLAMELPSRLTLKKAALSLKGKVFNANEMKNLLEGRKDVLRLDYSLAEERLDDNSEFKIDYHIMRK